jgi:hypothetical protein
MGEAVISVQSVIPAWIPVTAVSTSLATVPTAD